MQTHGGGRSMKITYKACQKCNHDVPSPQHLGKKHIDIKIALIGPPNVGKTTLFNQLTHSNQHVGNWPGKTVNISRGYLQYKNKAIEIVDLPGTYSFTGQTDEELVTREFLLEEKPDVIVVMTGANALARDLYLFLQIREFTRNIILVINKIDLLKKEGRNIDIEQLQEVLGLPIIPVNSLSRQGLKQLLELVINPFLDEKFTRAKELKYHHKIESFIEKLAHQIRTTHFTYKHLKNSRWIAIKILERDPDVFSYVKEHNKQLYEYSEHIHQQIHDELNKDPPLAIIAARYEVIDQIMKTTLKTLSFEQQLSDKIDNIIMNPLIQLFTTASVFILIFFISFVIGAFLQDLIAYTFNFIFEPVKSFLNSANAPVLLVSLLFSDMGLLNAVEAVIEFVPVIFLFFFFMTLLENTGLFSRIAFSLDRIFGKLGFEGKIFFPLTMSLGCNVIGVQNTRIIENSRLKLILITLSGYVPCSVRIAVLALLLFIIIKNPLIAAFILFFLIIFGYVLVLFQGWLLSKYHHVDLAGMILELPPYSIPPLKLVLRIAWIQTKLFITRAGKIMVIGTLLIWLAAQIPPNSPLENTVLGLMGQLLQILFLPLNFDWKATLALIFGFVAKENTLAVLQSLYGGLERIPLNFSLPSALAFLVFYTYYIPCLATASVIRSELGSWKHTIFALILNILTAYILALITYALITILLSF